MSSIQDPNYGKRLRAPEDDAGPSSPKKAKLKPRYVGVDFGTSNSALCIDGIQFTDPKSGSPNFRSDLMLGGKNYKSMKRLVGLNPEDAYEEAMKLGLPVIFAENADGTLKSDNSENPKKGAALYKIRLGGKDVEVTADFVVAAALLPLFKTVKDHVQDDPVEVCFGYPVHFNESKVERMKNIVKTLATIFKIQLVETKAVQEPVLAAYCFLTKKILANAFDGERKTVDVTVVDVGEGTTDCAVVRIRYLEDKNEYQIEVLDTTGDLVGGADITAKIAELLKERNKNKNLNPDVPLVVAELLKREIRSTSKKYAVHKMFPVYDLEAIITWSDLFSKNGKNGILDRIRSNFRKSVMALADNNGAEKMFLLVGGGTNFEPFRVAVTNRGGKTSQLAYGISQGAAAYIKENSVPIVSHPVAMSLGSTTIGKTGDKKANWYSKERRTFHVAIVAGTIVKETLQKTLVFDVPKSKKVFTLRIDIAQKRVHNGDMHKVEDIGEIRGDVEKGQMGKILEVVFTVTKSMSLEVVALIEGEIFGRFYKLGRVNTENEEETSSVVSGDYLSENLKIFMAAPNSDSDSDEEESDSDEPPSKDANCSGSGSKKRPSDSDSNSDEEESDSESNSDEDENEEVEHSPKKILAKLLVSNEGKVSVQLSVELSVPKN